MFHHIRKFSSAVKAISPVSVLYPKNNHNKVVVRGIIDQSHEESKKPEAVAGGTLLDQISLRPFEFTDVDDIMLWATDEQLVRYCGWEEIGIKGIYTSKEDALEDIKNNTIPHPWCRAICLNNQPIGKIFVDSCMNDQPIGRLLVDSCNGPYPFDDKRSARFGHRFGGAVSYVVASKHWGKGIATTALKMVLDTIFKERPHLIRLAALVHVENLASHRVFEKAGFLKEGVVKKYYLHNERLVDVASFSFLSTDFKQQQQQLD